MLAWFSRLFVAVFLVSVASSISANAESLKTCSPNLPLGDINVVILTDVHSWLHGHGRHEPKYDADLGDVLSFWERLKEQCSEEDIFLVNNGDFVDGTGLSETIDGNNNPEFLIPLLEKMPYDAVNVGNHELYSKKNIQFMTRPGGYVDWWGDRYITSNINRVDPTAIVAKDEPTIPLGNRYKILEGKHSKLLVFGFLYNMYDYARGAGIEIEKVQTTVQQQWFLDALSEEDYDGILVLAHMDLVDPLVDVVRSAIRDAIGDTTAVVFATGHTHYRGFKQLEDLSMTFEAGRYLDTVGFVSLPSKDSILEKKNTTSVFGHKYLDASKKVLFQDTLGFETAEEAKTKDGKEFSDFIDHTRAKLGLDRELGCAPMNYYTSKHPDLPGSMWGLYRDEVVPKVFKEQKILQGFENEIAPEEDLPYAMLLPSGNWRYNLYNNASVVVDDVYAISPFNDTVIHMGVFSPETILALNQTMNHKKSGHLPSLVLVGDLVGKDYSTKKHHLYTHEFGMANMKKSLEKIAPSEKVEITKTKITSSLIWLAFVEKYWPCDGTLGKLPDWFPQHKQSNHQTFNSIAVDHYDWLALLPMTIITWKAVVFSALAVMAWFKYQKIQELRRRRRAEEYVNEKWENSYGNWDENRTDFEKEVDTLCA